MLAALAAGAVFALLGGFFTVIFTGEYRDILVGVYRYALRVEAYAGLLTDTYPSVRLARENRALAAASSSRQRGRP